MRVPLWAAELADAFWELVGYREPFPRNLRQPIARALPMTVISLPSLRLADVIGWLRRNRVDTPCGAVDRGLYACLAAWKGSGFVFLDGSDPEDEQRLSLAHELAHFLRHYWHPRHVACRQLGEQVLDVLDGRRPPTSVERVQSLLTSAPMGMHWHLLERDSDATRLAEDEADRLAYELLAPADEMLLRAASPSALAALLQTTFGLPADHARRYRAILHPPPARDPLLSALRLI